MRVKLCRFLVEGFQEHLVFFQPQGKNETNIEPS